ncbi:Spindle pole body component [Teratosphaeria destructans]|uniref:Spindle pole body component n=1 Tax=Teratosphaeria destructans TaxID=418781 RepID=A0A9W7SN32_9PEZI|nr:Spindle pole body component [Teratosphaeria destructans]
MLHEVLLALSGHPSPLFLEDQQKPDDQLFALLSESEKALLKSIGRLANQHRRLRTLVQDIAKRHPSIICRAAATSLQQVHLARFQKKILEVESSILTKDAKIVGAYDIVPLAAVVSEFDGWHRLMNWFWDLACFMQPAFTSSGEAEGSSATSGAMLINRLRSEAQTGYPDIHKAAVELSQVVESAWLRQLSGWLLYGKLPAHGAQDFFVKSEASSEDGTTHFRKDRDLLPGFVTPTMANTVLFVGKSLGQVKKHARKGTALPGVSSQAWNEAELISSHLAHLSALSLPLHPAQLSRALSAIKLSLSQNVLQHILPMRDTLMLLDCFKQYFLLGRGEFAVALVDEAERRLAARQQSMGRLIQQDPIKALQGLSIKDAELQDALHQAWKTLTREDEHGEDMTLDFAIKHSTLSSFAVSPQRLSASDSIIDDIPQVSSVAFDDVLFPSSAWLQLDIQPPLDLFVSPQEVATYSSINAYLVAIRRAQVRLADLWRRTAARRDHHSATGRNGRSLQHEARQRYAARVRDSRKVWATSSAANFLVSEIAAYFEGEIIRESYAVFEAWVKAPSDDPETSMASTLSEPTPEATHQRDPETLAAGHRSFLASLIYALLLTDYHFTRDLRSLLKNLDALIAFFNRLLDVQAKLDLEIDAGALARTRKRMSAERRWTSIAPGKKSIQTSSL